MGTARLARPRHLRRPGRPVLQPGRRPSNLNNYGYILQAGYAFNQHWEIFGRYDQTIFDPDGQAADVENQVPEITLGVNYYINGHAAKLTADVVYLPNGFDRRLRDANGKEFNTTGAGILPTTPDSNELVARLQFQLLL